MNDKDKKINKMVIIGIGSIKFSGLLMVISKDYLGLRIMRMQSQLLAIPQVK